MNSSKPLSPRERQVHELRESGISYEKISSVLGIKPGTVKWYAGKANEKLNPKPLTPREEQILYYRLCNLSQREIANKLRVSLTTVKVHTTAILRKMGTKNLSKVGELVNITDYLPDYWKGYAKKGLCISCTEPNSRAGKGGLLCPACNARHNRSTSKTKQKNIAQGLCAWCGQENKSKCRTCDTCRDRFNARRREKYLAQKLIKSS